MKKALLAFALVCFSQAGFSQATRFNGQATSVVAVTGVPVVSPLPGATVNVCNYPAAGFPCSNLATVYTDVTGGTICNGANGCSNPMQSDAFGNFGFWVPTGHYQYTIKAANGTNYGPYEVTLVGGGASTLVPNTWGPPQTFSSQAIFSAGITGTGDTGAISAGTGITNGTNTWTAPQTTSLLNGVVNLTVCIVGTASWCPAGGASADLGDIVTAAITQLPTVTLPSGVTAKRGTLVIANGNYTYTKTISLTRFISLDCDNSNLTFAPASASGAALLIGDTISSLAIDHPDARISNCTFLKSAGTALVQNATIGNVSCVGATNICTFTSGSAFTGFAANDDVYFDNFLAASLADAKVQHARGKVLTAVGTTMTASLPAVTSDIASTAETNAIVTKNLVGGYFGGDPLSILNSSASYGDDIHFYQVRFMRFYCGQEQGSNTWNKVFMGGELFGSAGAGICVPQDSGTARSENDKWIGTVLGANSWGIWNDGGIEMKFIGAGCDYNQTLVSTGPPAVYSGGCMEGFGGTISWESSHIEQHQGPFFTSTGGFQNSIVIQNSSMSLFDSAVTTEVPFIFHNTSSKLILTNINAEFGHQPSAWIDNSIGSNTCFLKKNIYYVGAIGTGNIPPLDFTAATGHAMQSACDVNDSLGQGFDTWFQPFTFNNRKTNSLGTSSPIFAFTQSAAPASTFDLFSLGVNPANTNDALDLQFGFTSAGSASNFAQFGMHGAATFPLRINPTTIALPALVNAPCLSTGSGGVIQSGCIVSESHCVSAASPAVCAASPQGFVNIAAAASTIVVNTTAVTANSTIDVRFDESLGTALGVTCNVAGASEGATYFVSARTAGTSFTIKTTVAPTTNPACMAYSIVN